MNISKTRKQIIELNSERSELINSLLQVGKMIKGTLCQSGRTCGNPNCKCARGEKHFSWYLSNRINGKTKSTYVGAAIPQKIQEYSQRYHQRKNVVIRIHKIDTEITRLLNSLRDAFLVSVKEVKTSKKGNRKKAKKEKTDVTKTKDL